MTKCLYHARQQQGIEQGIKQGMGSITHRLLPTRYVCAEDVCTLTRHLLIYRALMQQPSRHLRRIHFWELRADRREIQALWPCLSQGLGPTAGQAVVHARGVSAASVSTPKANGCVSCRYLALAVCGNT